MNRVAIKSAARQQLSNNYGLVLGALFLFSLINIAASFFSFVSLFVTGPLSFGLISVMLGIIRNTNPTIDTLFNGFKHFSKSFCASLLMSIYTLLWTLLFIIPGIIKIYSYSMTYYILNDNPNMSVSDAIAVSEEMMKGHKFELFMLELSFLGWVLLTILTFGLLGIFYVAPYQNLAYANFYEELKATYLSQWKTAESVK